MSSRSKASQSSTASASAESDADDTRTKAELTECLFQQYAFTFAGLSLGTGYVVARKPPNGLMKTMVAGATGTLADLAYGWFSQCRPQVEAYQNLLDRENRAKQAAEDAKRYREQTK